MNMVDNQNSREARFGEYVKEEGERERERELRKNQNLKP